jgi:hypothetical protein
VEEELAAGEGLRRALHAVTGSLRQIIESTLDAGALLDIRSRSRAPT